MTAGMIRMISVILISLPGILQSLECQEIADPNQAMKSHETLEIKSIEFSEGKTVVNLVIENRIQGGNFCADKNIFIIDPAGRRLRLIKAVNIPVCPGTYNFKSIGEKLYFSLEFPALNPGTEWIDIVEQCDNNCFWFYGVTLDESLNRKLNETFALSAGSDPEKHMMLFRELLKEIDAKNYGIEGLIYINIIVAARETGDQVEASVWYKRLLKSGAPRVDVYTRYLNDRGIKY
jgi:hypothetical protein